MEDNPYRPPRFDELPRIGPDTATGAGAAGLAEAEIRAFVGKNADYYLRIWPLADEVYGRARGFNWAAFFLSGLWVPYRKMYRVAWVAFGMIAAESVLEDIAVASGLATGQSLTFLSRLVSLIFSIVCGSFGNAWYFAHARREIARIRSLGLDDEAYREALARRGGTSYVASLGLFCLFLAVMVIIGAATELFLSAE